jgi:hypothetical protein
MKNCDRTCENGTQFTRETGGQNPCGCRSKSKPRCRPRIFERRRGNPASRAPTRSAGRNAAVPVATKDAPGFEEIFCGRRGRFPCFPPEARNNFFRRQVGRVTSRPLAKIAVLNFRKAVGIRLELCGDFIAQRYERGTRTRIGQDAFPHGITVQLRQNGWQILHQFFPFRGR